MLKCNLGNLMTTNTKFKHLMHLLNDLTTKSNKKLFDFLTGRVRACYKTYSHLTVQFFNNQLYF